MKSSFFIKVALLILLYSNFSQAEESLRSNAPDNVSHLATLKHFVRERLAGLYYNTSVVGYSSSDYCVIKFLKQKFHDGWTLSELKISPDHLPHRSEAGFKPYAKIEKEPTSSPLNASNTNEDLNLTNLELAQHNFVYQYLTRITSNGVQVILLGGYNDIAFARSDRNTIYAHDNLKSLLLEILQRRLELRKESEKEYEAYTARSNEISKLKFESDRDPIAIRTKLSQLLQEQESYKDRVKQRDRENNEIKIKSDALLVEFKKYRAHRIYFPGIDLGDDNFHSLFLGTILQRILTNFPAQTVTMHTLVASGEEVASSYINRFISTLNWSDDPYIGHYCYGKIIMNSLRSAMNVEVVDPFFNPERPWLRSIFGSTNALPNQSSQLFGELARTVGANLQHTYHYRGDQVLNMHDCGRFSTIYLLASLEDKSVMSLSNYDIYLGFKVITQANYELLHQTRTDEYSDPSVQTYFAKYVSSHMRLGCDLALKVFYSQSPK